MTRTSTFLALSAFLIATEDLKSSDTQEQRSSLTRAPSALLVAAQDPNSPMPPARKAMIRITNEVAVISGQGILARTDTAKQKWLERLNNVEADLKDTVAKKDELDLTTLQVDNLIDTQKSIEELRDMLKVE